MLPNNIDPNTRLAYRFYLTEAIEKEKNPAVLKVLQDALSEDLADSDNEENNGEKIFLP